MHKYTIKRILLLIPTLFIVLTIVFVLMKLIPGSPISGFCFFYCAPIEKAES